ncbi:MAG: ABC transporter permease subunit [Lentisphaerae bacterium]|nr:ABC transporter permease subunit [Lentisphaerota bacterium]
MADQVIKWRQIKHHWEIYLFVLPTLLAIGLFIYYPAASGVFHSFFRWNGADIAEPVGAENYKDLLFSSEFWQSFRNAFIFGFWNVVKMIPPLFVAVAIHRCRSDRWQFLYRALFVIPMVIPPLIVALIWRNFILEATNGYLNALIAGLHLKPVLNALAPLCGWGDVFARAEPPAWLGDTNLIFTSVVIWGFPWISSLAVLTHLAKLQGIPKDVYEAGDIDGVNWWTKFTRLELPLITSSIYIMLVFVIIGTITDAGMVLALTGGFEGGPGGRVDVPALFMLRKAFMEQKMGYACAVGIILMVIVMSLQKVTVLIQEWSSYDPDRRRALRRRLMALAVVLNVVAPCMSIWGENTSPLLAALRAHPGAAMAAWLRGWTWSGYEAYFPQILRNGSWLLALAALPWGACWSRMRAGASPASPLPGTSIMAAVIPSRGEQRAARIRIRNQTPAYRAAARAGNAVLVTLRHGYIWAVLAFSFLPLYLMLIVSFKSNTQFYRAPAMLTFPLHLENWSVAWRLITPTLANSVFLSVSSTVVMLVMALMAAYFFARLRMPLSGLFWNAILVLMMLPMIANLVPLFRLLRDLNLLNTLSALILVGAAQGQIFAVFMLRSFVADIPRDLYEAAEIDGASHLRQMWLIVLPLSGPILGTVGVMHFMTAWNDFVLPLIVMRDHARLPVMVQLIRIAGEYIKLWGPLMAGYAMAAVPIIVLFIASMRLFVRGMTEGAVKG